jgi:hypothetical protein
MSEIFSDPKDRSRRVKYRFLVSQMLFFASGVLSVQASVFYEIETVAKVGDRVSGDQITSIASQVSTNDRGEVAFVAGLTGSNPGDGVVHGKKSGAGFQLTRLNSPNIDARGYSFAQINNDNRVIARERVSTNSVLRLWNVLTPGTGTFLTSTTLTPLRSVAFPSRSEDKTVIFVGLDSNVNWDLYQNKSEILGTRDANTSLRSLARGGPWPMAGNKETWVAKTGTRFNDPIIYYDGAFEINLSVGTANSGRSPGITADGEIVAFLADDSIRVKIPGLAALTVLDSTTPIAVDGTGAEITFSSFDYESRIGVIRHPGGKPGPVGDTLHLTFIGTPSSASRSNPIVPANPLLFSPAKGIWSLRVDIDTERDGSNSTVLNPWGALPVIQVEDVVDGSTVTNLTLYDPLGQATTKLDGTARIPERNDHYLCFHASSSTGGFVGMASRLDTDGDGMADHWERPGGGIDIDQDGSFELELSAMGASVTRKDAFLEIDWTNPRSDFVPIPWNNYPKITAIARLIKEYAMAPVSNPDGSMGITLHVDAGPYRSRNMGTWSRQGGDIITMPGSLIHPDTIMMEETAPTVPGLEAVTMTKIKDLYFGTTDRRARELVFRYCVFCDFTDLLFMENPAPAPPSVFLGSVVSAGPQDLTASFLLPDAVVIKITSGKGAGQVRFIETIPGTSKSMVDRPWTIVPDSTSRFVIFEGSSGIAEVCFRQAGNNHSLPGNDFMVSLGSWILETSRSPGQWYEWRTMMHEMGHTLGLLHGGTDHDAYKTNYNSIMSYTHQLEKTSTVNSYSTGGDPSMFNDWAEFQLETYGSLTKVGHSGGRTLGDGPGVIPEQDYTFRDFLQDNGPNVDINPPIITVETPGEGTGLSAGESLEVIFSVNEAVLKTSAAFDLNGNGELDSGEMITTTALGGNRYSASFGTIAGVDGIRPLFVFAEDNELNEEEFMVELRVGELSMDLQDDDGDLLTNLIEEALGTNPQTADRLEDVLVMGIQYPEGATELTLTYPRDDSQAGLEVRAQVSRDMATWTSIGVTEEVLETVGTISKIKASAPGFAGDSTLYFRVHVRRLP